MINRNDHKFTDEELVRYAQEGDENALNMIMERYEKQIRHIMGTFFVKGAERSDLRQEGLIGLYEAVMSYDPSKEAAFRTFSGKVILRKVLKAVEKGDRKKHEMLNNYSSLDNEEGEGGNDPLDILIDIESSEELNTKLTSKLTPLEKEVLKRYLTGESYVTIAEGIKRNVKSVDNAIQRIRHKLNPH